MADNNSDDPFAPPEARSCVRVPVPGGARSGSRRRRQRSAASPRPAAGLPGSPHCGSPRQPDPARVSPISSPAPQSHPAVGRPLLLLAARLRQPSQQATSRRCANRRSRRSGLSRSALRAAAVAREDALVARYVLCTFVDNAVLNTPWGAQSDWASQSLLVMFHKEVSGGEKFFEILERFAPIRPAISISSSCCMSAWRSASRASTGTTRTARPGCRNSSTTCSD